MSAKKMALAIVTFTAVCAASALIGWLGGYDFNERGPGVAYWAAATLAVAFCLAKAVSI